MCVCVCYRRRLSEQVGAGPIDVFNVTKMACNYFGDQQGHASRRRRKLGKQLGKTPVEPSHRWNEPINVALWKLDLQVRHQKPSKTQ